MSSGLEPDMMPGPIPVLDEQQPEEVEQAPDIIEQEPEKAEQEPQKVEQDPKKVEQEPKKVDQGPRKTKQEPGKVERWLKKIEQAPALDNTPSTPTSEASPEEAKSTPEINIEQFVAELLARDLSEITSVASTDTEDIKRMIRNAFIGGCTIFWSFAILFAMVSWRVGGQDTEPLKLVTRKQWDQRYEAPDPKTFISERVVVTHTETKVCNTTLPCEKLLNEISHDTLMENNFLISSNGEVYEALGWHTPSPLYKNIPTTVVSFIGNYAITAPAQKQITQFRKLVNESIDLNYLRSTYNIYGRRSNVVPIKLFIYLEDMERWNKASLEDMERWNKGTDSANNYFDDNSIIN